MFTFVVSSYKIFGTDVFLAHGRKKSADFLKISINEMYGGVKFL